MKMNHSEEMLTMLVMSVPFILLVAAKSILRLNWMYLGLAGSVFLFFAFLTNRSSPVWDGRRLAMALLITYLLHQFEEHGVDFFGNRYAFQASANKLLGPILGCAPSGNSECPLTIDAIYWANTLLVWWPLVLSLTMGVQRRVLQVCASGLTLANTLAHIVPAVVTRSYNPGLVSALVLFVPLDIAVLWNARQAWGCTRYAIALGFVWGALGHPLLLLAAFAVYWQEIAPTWIYPAVLFAYACLPLLVPHQLVIQMFESPKRMRLMV